MILASALAVEILFYQLCWQKRRTMQCSWKHIWKIFTTKHCWTRKCCKWCNLIISSVYIFFWFSGWCSICWRNCSYQSIPSIGGTNMYKNLYSIRGSLGSFLKRGTLLLTAKVRSSLERSITQIEESRDYQIARVS